MLYYYNIDISENGYSSLTGKIKSLTELKNILIKNGEIPDFVGYLSSVDFPHHSICICSEKNLGFYIGITFEFDNTIHLSLGDKNLLSEVVDVWGDGLYISKGLFIPVSLAWKALEECITSQTLCAEVNWITPDDIPEGGNFLEL